MYQRLIIIVALFFGSLLFLDAEILNRNEPIIKSGIVTGILDSKGEAWIDVKSDDGYTHRYLAKWKGSGPSSGGGFDQNDLRSIAKLVVGNRVRLEWFWENHLRIGTVQVTPPGQNGGIFKGYILGTSDRWVDAQNLHEGIPWRFYLPWVGGYPSNGGGYDQSLLNDLTSRMPTDPVRFKWVYDERSRIVELFEQGDDQFVPFYVGKKERIGVPRVTNVSEEAESTKEGTNPFEQAAPAGNPFEQVAPAGNPFEQVAPAGNPFEQVAPAGNPFEQVAPAGNPFEQAAPAGNPFEQAAPAGNPFEQAAPAGNPFEQAAPAGNPFEDMPLPK